MSISASNGSDQPVQGQHPTTSRQALRQWRTDHGLTQADAADLIHQADSKLNPSPETFRRWELGTRVPYPVYRRALALAMGMPVEELVALIEPSRIAREEVSTTKRRQFISKVGVTFVGAMAAGVVGGGIDFERLAAPGIDPTWLREAEAVSSAFAAVRSNVAPETLVPAVLGHLSGLEQRLPNSAELTARTSLLVGSLLTRAGRLGEAWRSYTLAYMLTKDPELEAKALSGMAGVSVRQGMGDVPLGAIGPNPDMTLALALQNQAAALVQGKGSERASAGIVAHRAEIRAGVGDDSGAMRDLDTALRGVDYEGHQWWYLSPEKAPELGAYRGSVLHLLGRHEEAVTELDWTLERMPVEKEDWRARIMRDREAALAAQG